MEMTRSRSWCFTINNYDSNDINTLNFYFSPFNAKRDNIRQTVTYAIFGLEKGVEGTPHIQGYVYWKNKLSFKQVKNILGNKAHIEIAKGSPEQNREYCSKEENFHEYGTMPKQGRRTDLNKVRSMIKEGNSLKDIHEVATSFQAIKFAESYIRFNEQKRNWKPFVVWLWGATGTGKSYLAEWIAGKDAWWSGETGKWWQGYDAHENVVFDDFRSDFCKYHVLLRILDRYPYTIECKGGSRQLLARTIVITSCYSPDQVYKSKEDKQQLKRRISLILHTGDRPEVKKDDQRFKTQIMASLNRFLLNDQKSGVILNPDLQ